VGKLLSILPQNYILTTMKRLFKQIGTGWLRLHILLSIAGAGPLLLSIAPRSLNDEELWFLFLSGIPLYWILVIAVHWIIAGFRSDQKRDHSPTKKDLEHTTFQTTEAPKVSDFRNANNVHEQPMGGISLEDTLDRRAIKEPTEVAEHTDELKEETDKVKPLNKYIKLMARILIYVLIFFVNYLILFVALLLSILAMTGDKGFASRQSPIWATFIAFGLTRFLGKKVISKGFPRFKSLYHKK
jgi:hypothetical protein